MGQRTFLVSLQTLLIPRDPKLSRPPRPGGRLCQTQTKPGSKSQDCAIMGPNTGSGRGPPRTPSPAKAAQTRSHELYLQGQSADPTDCSDSCPGSLAHSTGRRARHLATVPQSLGRRLLDPMALAFPLTNHGDCPRACSANTLSTECPAQTGPGQVPPLHGNSPCL